MIRRVAQVAALLGATACEYDARISVNPPDWAGARVVGAERAGCAPSAPLRIHFVLVDDRDAPVRDGSSIEVTSGAQVVVRAEQLSARIEGGALLPPGGGGATPIGDLPLTSIAWRQADDRALALVVEASSEAAAADPSDERFRAADGAARRYLADPSRRLAVFSLAGGGADERLPATSDLAQAAEAIGALAAIQGGDAPLWDGAIAAAAAAQGASPEGGSVLVVGAALVDRGSIADVDDAIAAVGATPVRAVSLVDDADLRDLACRSQGLFLAVAGPAELTLAAAAMVQASPGDWHGELVLPSVGAPPPGTYRLTGTLAVGLGGDERAVEIDVTIDVP